MSRYANVRNRKPRSRKLVFEALASSHRLYLETGGKEIDRAIESTQATHDLALERAQRYIPREDGRGRDPISEATKAARELRMLLQEREKKLAKCRADLDEMIEHDVEKQAAAEEGASPTEDVPVPEYFPEMKDEPYPEPIADETPETCHDQNSS
ncbi:MAG: hypothetical protein H6839_09705 [Planctomycetes bacterium]|nr:hypothetical protein [Planctomycetota bacterium]